VAKWYPIECEHGYDCCPMCDGPRRNTQTLARMTTTDAHRIDVREGRQNLAAIPEVECDAFG